MLLFILGFAFILLGTSYAFFDYIKIGMNHELIAGDIYMNFDGNDDSLSLNSIYPEKVEHARSRDDNYITFTIEGSNESDNDIYYEIDLIHGDNHDGLERFNDRDLRFDLVEVNGNTETIIMDSVNFNEINNTKIWVETIDSGTTSYNKTYKLRMWLDGNVLISDTEPNASYSASTYKNHYASVKIKVVGDFVEKKLYNVMGTFPTTITDLKANITEVYFINDSQSNIDERYNAASIKADITNISHTVGTPKLKSMTDYGKVLCWLEPIANTENYKLYVGSDGLTYLSNGVNLFNGWSNLVTLDMQNVRTDFITDMQSMFGNCTNLANLDISNFDTRNVTNMRSMFYNCSSLTNLNLSNFNTSNVNSMQSMFDGCLVLAILDLSNFNTSNVTNMNSMFFKCSSLRNLDLSSFDTSNVTIMQSMFFKCSSLTNLDLSNFDTNNVTNMNSMLSGCSNLMNLDLSHFDINNVTSMQSMFFDCSMLTNLDLSNWNTSNVTNMEQMFRNCSSLMSLDVSKFDTRNVTNMSTMFYNCSSLTSLDVSKFDTTNVNRTDYMFRGCTNLVDLDVSHFNTSNVTNMGSMFYGCSSLTSLDVSNFNTINVTNMSSMFSWCSNLTSLDLSHFDTRNVTIMENMFFICSKLKTIYVGNNWSTTSVTSSSGMFNYCSSIVGGNGTTYDSSHIDATYAHVDVPGNPGYLTLKTS